MRSYLDQFHSMGTITRQTLLDKGTGQLSPLGNLIILHAFDLGVLGVLGASLFPGPKWEGYSGEVHAHR